MDDAMTNRERPLPPLRLNPVQEIEGNGRRLTVVDYPDALGGRATVCCEHLGATGLSSNPVDHDSGKQSLTSRAAARDDLK
jgi:hypothetical protein